MKAIRIHEVGGPEVLKYEDCPSPAPEPGQALIDMQAIGVNFTDVTTRTGLYQHPSLPMTIVGGVYEDLSFPVTPGVEGAGVVSAVGDGVTQVSVGDTVAYWGVTAGSYAEQVAVSADILVTLPEGLDARTGATALVQGITAHYLALSAYPLKSGDSALIHAGAGGTGALLIQMAKQAGAYVFATVSTEEKAEVAREAGADKTIIYTREDFEEEVKKGTDGQGVQVVYDSVGKTTFEKSRSCLARRGYLLLYGTASGVVPPIAPSSLANGSLYLSNPGLYDYTATREELLWRAGEVFSRVKSGQLKLRNGGTFPLSEAAEAHRQLEGRKTTGKLLLIP